jgi:hypothetical protein
VDDFVRKDIAVDAEVVAAHFTRVPPALTDAFGLPMPRAVFLLLCPFDLVL